MLPLNFKIRPLVYFCLWIWLEFMTFQKIGQDQLIDHLRAVSKLNKRGCATRELDEHPIAGIIVGHLGF
ncbi:hypothetical protein D3C77_627790 [compost metagenome]